MPKARTDILIIVSSIAILCVILISSFIIYKWHVSKKKHHSQKIRDMHDAKNEPVDNNTKNNEPDINLEQGNIKNPAAVAKRTNKLTLMDIALIEAKKAAVHRESLKNTKDVSLSSPNSDIQNDNTEKDPIPINKQSCPTTRQTMINLRAIRNVSEKYYNPPSIVEPPKMEEDVGRKKSISIEPSESFKEAEALLNCQILHKDILAEEEDRRKEALKKGLNPEHKSPRFSRPSSSTKEGRLPISFTDCPPESPSMRTSDFPSLPPLFVINKEETRKTSAVLKEEELVGSGILHRDLQAEEDLIRQEAKRRGIDPDKYISHLNQKTPSQASKTKLSDVANAINPENTKLQSVVAKNTLTSQNKPINSGRSVTPFTEDKLSSLEMTDGLLNCKIVIPREMGNVD